MDGVLEPTPEGFEATDSVLDADGFIKKYPLRLGNAKSLLEMSDEYTFFTPAILYLHGRFRDAPLADFTYMLAPDCKFYFHRFAKPIFRGLVALSNGNADWNYVLWAVPKQHWDALAAWLVSVTLTYEDEKMVAGIGEQELRIVDPLAVDKNVIWHNGIPTMTVYAFGINSSRCQAGLAVSPSIITEPPRLVLKEPDDGMKVFATALYDGRNPLDAKAYHKWKSTLKEE